MICLQINNTNMKKYVTILLICFGLFSGIAQNRGGGKEKIKQLKIAYFTKNLDLSEEEAQQFWPVYNAFDDKNHELRRSLNRIKRDAKSNENMSETEATSILDRIQSIEKQVYENMRDLTNKLRKFLSAKKIIRLKKTEHEFNKELMKKFRDRRRKN